MSEILIKIVNGRAKQEKIRYCYSFECQMRITTRISNTIIKSAIYRGNNLKAISTKQQSVFPVPNFTKIKFPSSNFNSLYMES